MIDELSPVFSQGGAVPRPLYGVRDGPGDGAVRPDAGGAAAQAGGAARTGGAVREVRGGERVGGEDLALC